MSQRLRRWRFLDSANPDEAEYHRAMLAAMDRWWQTFAAASNALAASLAGDDQVDIPAFMHEHLQTVVPDIAWEMNGNANVGHVLVITPEADRHLRPLISTLLSRAPSIPAWRFLGHRPRTCMEDVAGLVRAKTGGDVSGWLASGSRGANNQVDLLFHTRERGDETRQREIAFATVECLVGEQVLDEWIGGIDVTRDRWFQRGRPIGEVPGLIDALIAEIRSGLLERPAKGAIFEMEPVPAEDYPGRQDMRIGRADLPDVWRASINGCLFFSKRFSNTGETFAT